VLRGTAAAGEGGKTMRRARGYDSPPHLGLGRPVEGGLLRRAEVTRGGPGGGAAGREGRRAVAGQLVVVEGCVRAYL